MGCVFVLGVLFWSVFLCVWLFNRFVCLGAFFFFILFPRVVIVFKQTTMHE